MTIRQLHPDDVSIVAPAQLATLLERPEVQLYLALLDSEVPGLDLTVDRAIGLGLFAVREARAGRLDEYRALAALTFDHDEHDALIAAALSCLEPLTRPTATGAPLGMEPPLEPATDPDEETRA